MRLATLRGLWTDTTEAYPDENETIWWEVWLRRQDGNELERLMEFAGAQEIEVAPRRLMFDDRIVTLVRATPAQLAASIDVLNDVAEVRKAKETATVFVDMGPEDQGEWAKELRDRVTPPSADAPAVCVLDTGVTRGHPLLDASLDAADCHTCEPAWGTHDHHGHGTEMAGLALYGDLTPVLAGTQKIALRHRLESVKILPPDGHANPPDLYGAVTAEAASRVEIQAPERRRTFSMSVAATDERDRGQPTSWSAAVDALAAGRSFDPSTHGLDYLDEGDDAARRLFVLCAGNVDETALSVDHLDRSDTDPIHDPGQAWNALTVGALTEKAVINDPKWASWQPVARPGELSPWSTTGVTFADAWPIKPDVVFEGGNVVKNAKGAVDFPCPDLSLLSTHFKPAEKSFVLTWATSAATAQAARLAALISAEYPTLLARDGARPHGAFGRMVGTDADPPATARAASAPARSSSDATASACPTSSARCGARTTRSPSSRRAASARSPTGKMRELHFFDLPWPREVLAELGATPVRLRVTLSYFIEPNPGRRGWKKRHRYASHGLRFDVKGPTESIDEFRKRLNKKALEEDEAKPATGGDSSEWYLGEHARNRGSLHSDILSCNAADLAERGVIAVYPVSGWWKDQPRRDRSDKGARYALVVSIETPGVDTDIWTPVAEQVGVPIAIES